MSLSVGNTYVFNIYDAGSFKAKVTGFSANPKNKKKSTLDYLLEKKLLTKNKYNKLLQNQATIPEIQLKITEENNHFELDSIINLTVCEGTMFFKYKSLVYKVTSYSQVNSTSQIPEGIPPPSRKKKGGKKKRSPAKRKPAKRKPAKRKPTGKKKVRKIHKGPRGGRYYISKGRKVYL